MLLIKIKVHKYKYLTELINNMEKALKYLYQKMYNNGNLLDLVVDHKKRIKVQEALNHEWFTLYQTQNINVNTVISPDIIEAIKNFQNQKNS